MNLKLLGVLQDWGTPFASLYVKEQTSKLFLSVSLSADTEKGNYVFSSLVVSVSSQEILAYLKQAIGIKRMIEESPQHYVWRHKKGERGIFKPVKKYEIPEEIQEDDMYDASFCSDEKSIRYYISKLN
jgi:protein subunit release factor B